MSGRINPPNCEQCKLRPRADEVDQCLGWLPGVMNACCGHSEPQFAYVQFSPRFRIAGRWARAYQWALRGLRNVFAPRYDVECARQQDRLRSSPRVPPVTSSAMPVRAPDLKESASKLASAGADINSVLWDISGLADTDEQRMACAECLAHMVRLGESLKRTLILLDGTSK